jgi:hypothetical protein
MIPNFIESGTLRPGTTFITRPAPGVGGNQGGGIEVVVPPNSINLNSFSTTRSLSGFAGKKRLKNKWSSAIIYDIMK